MKTSSVLERAFLLLPFSPRPRNVCETPSGISEECGRSAGARAAARLLLPLPLPLAEERNDRQADGGRWAWLGACWPYVQASPRAELCRLLPLGCSLAVLRLFGIDRTKIFMCVFTVKVG